jgi:SAM-dependent methyltransferase
MAYSAYSLYAEDQQRRIVARGSGRARFYIPYLKPGMSVLDVGCGPGSITIELAKAVSPGTVLGIDIDPPAVEKARTSAADAGVSNISFEVEDAAALPFADDSFDAACAASTFQWLKRPDRVAREVLRVLRPGGILVARDRAADGDLFDNLNPTLRRAIRLYERLSRHRGLNHQFGKRLHGLLRRAGFVDVETQASYDPGGRNPSYFMSPFIDPTHSAAIVRLGWADPEDLPEFVAAWKSWSEDPNSVMYIAWCQAVGRKPDSV